MSELDIMYVSMFSTIAPTALGVILFRKTTVALKVLTIFLILKFALELIAHYMYLSDLNNMLIFRIYTYLEFTVLSLIFFLIFERRVLKRTVLVSFLFFYLVSIFGLKIEYEEFNSYQNVVKAGFVLLFCVLYINQFSKTRKSSDFKLHPYFVMSAGLIIYFVGTTTVFMFGEDFLKEQDLSAWEVACMLNVFLNAIYCFVLWEMKKDY